MHTDLARVSAKGQIVIPVELRKKIGLTKGTRLLVLAEGQHLLMRVMTPPETGAFAKLIEKSFEMIKYKGKQYKALWSALQRHSISDLYRNI